MKPLYEKHPYDGTPGRIGSDCRTCGGPITESWHHPDVSTLECLPSNECRCSCHITGINTSHLVACCNQGTL